MKTTSKQAHTEGADCRSGQRGCVAWSSKLITLPLHVLGVLGVSFAMSWIVSDASAIRMLLLDAPQPLSASAPYTQSVLLHLLYSACIWVALIATHAMIKRRERRAGPRVVRFARGQVMVETLLVITPFLLLTGGLSQLIVNNIAGMLTHLSAYQAGRTCWVWAQEHERTGSTVDPSIAQLRAKLAAAAVLTPVAGGPASSGGDDQFNKMAGIMAAHFSDQSTAPRGSSQAVMADPALNPESYKDAFDTSPFSKRATQKLRAAYENTDVVCNTSGPVTVNVTYDHFLAFPWFGYIFENPGKPGYTRFTRSYQLPLQVPPK